MVGGCCRWPQGVSELRSKYCTGLYSIVAKMMVWYPEKSYSIIYLADTSKMILAIT